MTMSLVHLWQLLFFVYICRTMKAAEILLSSNLEGEVCPGTELMYLCESDDPTAVYAIWKLPRGECNATNLNPLSDGIRLLRTNNPIACANVSGTCGRFIATNTGLSTDRTYCTSSVLTVKTSVDMDGSEITCIAYVFGQAFSSSISAIIQIATPQPPIISLNASLDNIFLQVHGITAFNATVLAFNHSASIRITNGSTCVFNGLQPNTNYSISVKTSRCGWNSTTTTMAICTLASPPNDIKVYSDTSDNIIAIWNHVGGCVTFYDVRIVSASSGNTIWNDTVLCSYICIYLLPSVKVGANEYILLVASITDGNAGQASSLNIRESYKPQKIAFNCTKEDTGTLNNSSDCRLSSCQDKVLVTATLSSLSSLILGSVISSVLCLCLRSRTEHFGCKEVKQKRQLDVAVLQCSNAESQIQLQQNEVYGLINAQVNKK